MAFGIESAIGAGIGAATTDWSNRKQLEQQEKLQKLGIEGSKEMGNFNKGLAIDTWKETASPMAQVDNMRKAGLNTGLMYSGAGGGGGATTTAGNVGAGSAENTGSKNVGMGMQLGMQAELQKAQVENINANTEKTKVEAAKTAGVDTEEAKGRLNKLAQETQNATIQEGILKYQKEITGMEAHVNKQNMEGKITQMAQLTDTLEEKLKQERIKTGISEETADELIKQAEQDTIEQAAKIIAMNEGIKWDYGNVAQTERLIGMATDILGAVRPSFKINTKTDKKQQSKTQETEADRKQWKELGGGNGYKPKK